MENVKRVVFALYDQLGHKSKEYRDHVRAISMFDIQVSMDRFRYGDLIVTELLEGNNIDDLISKAYSSGCNYIYLMSIGYITSDHSLLNDIHQFAVDNQYWLVGHILEDQFYHKTDNGFFHLHPQSFYLNLDIWANLGKPKFGNRTTITDFKIPGYNRSPENIHDDYTPLWLMPASTPRDTFSGVLNAGWNLIATMLSAGCKVGNFSESIRRRKSYLYPEIDDNRFERILGGEQGLTVEPTGPTYAQYYYLKETDFTNVTGAVFVFNNDNMSLEKIAYYPTTRLGTLYAVAAGFKPLQLLSQVDCDTARVVYIDYSEDALNYRQWLVDNWDGNDYMQAIEQYRQVNPNFDPIWMPGKQAQYPQEWENTLRLFGGQQQWLKFWNKYKALEHRYIKTNLLNEFSAMIADMKQHPGNNMIWISNSFNTPATIRNFPPGTLSGYWNTFLTSVRESNLCIQVIGKDHDGGYQTKLHGQVQYE
jgi:hypothetical protein